jgi:hypothetical protein
VDQLVVDDKSNRQPDHQRAERYEDSCPQLVQMLDERCLLAVLQPSR